ncbi:hypothetical protein [Streptomyces sp. NPDC049590]|uniref:hypothetical protein n=1 Tax=Streptomyces sp. NPDC049590 TaxID=3154834 RepID=UPI00341C9F0B
MNEWTTAVGALVLVLSLGIGALLSRAYFAPVGAHRAQRGLSWPQALEVNDLGYCPAEGRTTLHAFHADGSRTCWTCRTITTDTTPPGGTE